MKKALILTIAFSVGRLNSFPWTNGEYEKSRKEALTIFNTHYSTKLGYDNFEQAKAKSRYASFLASSLVGTHGYLDAPYAPNFTQKLKYCIIRPGIRTSITALCFYWGSLYAQISLHKKSTPSKN